MWCCVARLSGALDQMHVPVSMLNMKARKACAMLARSGAHRCDKNTASSLLSMGQSMSVLHGYALKFIIRSQLCLTISRSRQLLRLIRRSRRRRRLADHLPLPWLRFHTCMTTTLSLQQAFSAPHMSCMCKRKRDTTGTRGGARLHRDHGPRLRPERPESRGQRGPPLPRPVRRHLQQQ